MEPITTGFSMDMIRISRPLFLLSLTLPLSSGLAQAERPSVDFDFGSTAECRELLSAEPSGVYPDGKIVELKLRISVHLTAGDLDKVDELRIEVVDCDRKIRVHSFEPNTRLESRMSEDIQWSRTIETGASLRAALGGEVPVFLGTGVANVTPTINGGKTNREIVTEVQKRIAPKHVVVTSGTIDSEHGVFFKLHRSPQSSLEGVHELTVRFAVPKNWRGDSIQVCCQATGQEKFLWLKQQAIWTHACSRVAVYLAGDARARRAAVNYIKQRSVGS